MVHLKSSVIVTGTFLYKHIYTECKSTQMNYIFELFLLILPFITQ